MRTLALALSMLLFFHRFAGAWDWNSLDADKTIAGGAKLFKAAAGMKDSDEVRLGREVAANLAARYRLSEDETQLRYLNLVGQALAQRSSRAKLPFHFGILKSEEYNAYAAPGGYIFVTEGLLKFIKDEAELAGVLAHEISHVSERHIVQAIRDANLLGAGKDLAAATGHDVDAYAPLTDFSINLLERGHSRKDELEADREGTRLAAKLGYDPRGLRDAVARLDVSKTKDPVLARFRDTHPPVPQRLKAIDAALPKSSADQTLRLSERYRQYFPR